MSYATPRKLHSKMVNPLRKSRLHVLQTDFDDVVRRDLAEAKVSCKRGCSRCCYELPQAMYLEAVEAVRAARKNGHTIDTEELKRQVNECSKFDINDDERRNRWRTACVFLKKGKHGNECAAYAGRPLQCRSLYVASAPKECNGGKVIQYDLDSRHDHAEARMRIVHIENNLIPVVGPLPVMVQAVLDGASTYELTKRKDVLNLMHNDRDADWAESKAASRRTFE